MASSLDVEVDVGCATALHHECLEVWFLGAPACVTVGEQGACTSTSGARHHGDAYNSRSPEERAAHVARSLEVDVSYVNWETGRAFKWPNVRVPLPPAGLATALCVDVVGVEYASPTGSSNRPTVYRRKASATFFQGGGSTRVQAPSDVPLAFRPRVLEVASDTKEFALHTAVPLDGWLRNFTLNRGTATLRGGCLVDQKWARPPRLADVYARYLEHRDALEAWASSAHWDALGLAVSPAQPDLPFRMKDIPTWFPCRLTPHVPGLMCVDPEAASPFRGTREWWRAQLDAVLERAGVSPKDFEGWSASEQRTACVAMRVAKLWACSRRYVSDWLALRGGIYVENEVYNDMRIMGSGDCDDYALAVYRSFVSLSELSGEEDRGLQLCAEACRRYVPFMCSGLYHDPDFTSTPPAGDDGRGDDRTTEHPHAFVLAFREEWVRYWLGKAERPVENPRPLLGDGTCWPDPCMDGGEACAREHFPHEQGATAQLRAQMIARMRDACATNPTLGDALALTFMETNGKTKRPGQFHMHDCVVTLKSAVPAARGFIREASYGFQFRRASEAAGSLKEIIETPESVRLEACPAFSLPQLDVFRAALRFERPASPMRVSPEKRRAMDAIVVEISGMLGVAQPSQQLERHDLAMIVSTENFLRRYPSLKVADPEWLQRACDAISQGAAACGMRVVAVRRHTGTSLWVALALTQR